MLNQRWSCRIFPPHLLSFLIHQRWKKEDGINKWAGGWTRLKYQSSKNMKQALYTQPKPRSFKEINQIHIKSAFCLIGGRFIFLYSKYKTSHSTLNVDGHGITSLTCKSPSYIARCKMVAEDVTLVVLSLGEA